MKQPLIVSQDPRQGKTALSIRLAKAIGGEIVSADSMQVYRHMDIGSAKVTPGKWTGFPIISLTCWIPGLLLMWPPSSRWQRRPLRRFTATAAFLSLPAEPDFIYRPLLYDIDFKENEDSSPVRRGTGSPG